MNIDAGQSRRVLITAHRIDMAAESGLLGDGVIDDHQNHQDEARDRERGTGTSGAKQPGQIANDNSAQCDADHNRPQRFFICMQFIRTGALTKLCVTKKCDSEDAQQQRGVVHSRKGRAPLRQMTGAEPFQFRRSGDGDGVGDPDDSAAENHHAAQGSDKTGNTHLCHPEAVPCANQNTDSHAQQHRCPPGEIPFLECDGHDHSAETGNGTDGQVNLTDDNDHQHTNSQNQHVRITRQKILEIGGGNHFSARGNIEENDQCNQRDYHRVFMQVVSQHFFNFVHKTIPSFPSL